MNRLFITIIALSTIVLAAACDQALPSYTDQENSYRMEGYSNTSDSYTDVCKCDPGGWDDYEYSDVDSDSDTDIDVDSDGDWDTDCPCDSDSCPGTDDGLYYCDDPVIVGENGDTEWDSECICDGDWCDTAIGDSEVIITDTDDICTDTGCDWEYPDTCTDPADCPDTELPPEQCTDPTDCPDTDSASESEPACLFGDTDSCVDIGGAL